ncbi:MAG TPA: DNA ligase D [Verrucomicrobiae bacterium]|nr:DNA ligase D [Verrucomicrobiae bacterium]
MGLGKYFRKRNFRDTPEPRGRLKASHSKQLRFVIQKHHASRLHYDFRLELDGVLKSWAVPKGPSLDPHERRLAMMVEDHPFEYRNFEGTIPKGNYGAGEVIIWDEGTYEPRKPTSDSEKLLRKELKQGHITFILHGEKLHGEFALIRMHADEENAWLLVKKDDEFVTTEDILLKDVSVRTGKALDDHTAPDLQGYPAVKSPWQVQPMLCTLVDEPFDGDEWLFEIKWDGYRAIASKHKNQVQLYSRTGQNFLEKYSPVAEALQQLSDDVIFDGEIVVVDDKGQAHFEWLQSWHRDRIGDIHYYVFDILWYNGRDIRTMPLIERKNLLKRIISAHSVIHYSDHIIGKGIALFEQVKASSMEGVVAKKASSAYQEKTRGPQWLKIKTQLRQEVVIGGFTEPRGGRKYLGSLIVGVYKDGDFVYVGHSGGGIPDEQRRELQQRLLKLERKTSPFLHEPKPNAPVHWVKPEMVCEMAFTEWTEDGYMRHPRFVGLREDKKPQTIRRELVKEKQNAMKKTSSTKLNPELHITHPDKVFFPKTGYTKGDLIDYYSQIASFILPYIKDRPLSLLRQPDGIKGEAFFQKNIEHLPEWLPSVDIYSESNKKDLHWMVGTGLDALLYAVQLGSIEINPWNSRVGQLDNPDWAVIDLDPEGVTFQDVITVAQTVKQVCDEWKIPAYPKTSGKTGIHIFIPMGAKYTYEQVKNFAHLIALEVNKRQPKLTSVLRMPEKRPNKIYLDFLQNRQGQTLAAPYAVRPTDVASVSTPLHWDEVTAELTPELFTIRTILPRLEKIGDIWKPVIGKGINLEKILKNIES